MKDGQIQETTRFSRARGLGIIAAILIIFAVGVWILDQQLDFQMSFQLANQKLHSEKVAAIGQDVRKTQAMLLEHWLFGHRESGNGERELLEQAVHELERSTWEFARLKGNGAREQQAQVQLTAAITLWADHLLQSLHASEKGDPIMMAQLHKDVERIDTIVYELMEANISIGEKNDFLTVSLQRRRGAVELIFLGAGIAVLVLAAVWWRRIGKTEQMYLASEQERRQQEHAAKLRADFFATMSHELRTPLVAIRGFASLVENANPIAPTARDAAQRIQREAHDLLGIINNILDAAKLESGQVQLLIEDISVELVVHRCVARCEGLIGQKPVELIVELAPNLPSLRADFVKLQQILTNLLGNAIKFTESGKVVLRASERSLSMVTLEIEDTGVGIEPEALSVIWEPFRQAGNAVSRKFGGTGLGLSIVRNLVGLLEGEISIESTVGVGTKVTLNLPAARSLVG